MAEPQEKKRRAAGRVFRHPVKTNVDQELLDVLEELRPPAVAPGTWVRQVLRLGVMAALVGRQSTGLQERRVNRGVRVLDAVTLRDE